MLLPIKNIIQAFCINHIVFYSIILIAWAKNWEGNVIYSASLTVTSYFGALNLLALIEVVLYIVQTVLLPMYAKFADMVGRTEGFVIAIFFYILSGIVQAVSPNIDTLIVNIISIFYLFKRKNNSRFVMIL
jgi:MFS family permease